ncbi:MAG: OsmC family protein [Leptospira sp.]|nr:OsmC family protein [Leptospira sp.]
MSEHKISLSWKKGSEEFTFETYDRTHAIQFNGGQSIFSSSTKETFGNDEHANPEELLASAVSSCHMLTFLAVASKKKKIVTDYTDEATAILEKGDSGKMQVTKIFLKPRVRFGDGVEVSQDELEKMHDAAHRNCFIGLSVKSEVIVEPEFS